MGQAAIVLVISLTVLMTTIGGVMISDISNNDPILTQASIQRYAYRALASGLNSYQSAINANPYLAACNYSTNGTAQCAGLTYETWSEVPDTDLGNGIIPEYYKFDNPQAEINSTTHQLISLQVQIVGAAGFSGKDVYYSTVAKFVPVNGFLDNVWWTNFESEGTPANCSYWWAPTGGGHTAYEDSGGCTPVHFTSSDIINGPAFSNDSIFVQGTVGPPIDGPSFGTTAAPYAVTTADPGCLFVDDANPGLPPGGCADDEVAAYNTTTSSNSAKNFETIPTDNSKLGNYAQQDGCYYVGPTTITLNGNTMTVLSPDSVGVANLDFGSDTSTCPTDGVTSAPLPANGVIYVDQNPAGNPLGTPASPFAGVNPFDGYTTTCPPPGHGSCTEDSQSGQYFGQTSNPDTEGDAFVQGSLSGHLTIGTKNDIIVDGPITYADCTSWTGTAQDSACNYNPATGSTPNDTLGLIAYNYVEVSRPVDSSGKVLPTCGSSGAPTAPLCDPATSSGSPKGYGLTIDASILALQQSFAVNNNDATGTASGGSSGGPTKEGSLTIYGSIQQDARGPVGTGGATLSTGYLKDYEFDPRLAFYSPPYYLAPGTASWSLDSSSESYTGNEPTCPPTQSTPSPTGLTWPIAGSTAVGTSPCLPAS